MGTLVDLGFKCFVESGAGVSNGNIAFPDEAYETAGCKIVKDDEALIKSAGIIAKVRLTTTSSSSPYPPPHTSKNIK